MLMKILSVLILILSSVYFVLADIPAPPVANEIRVEIDKNYPDYQFYLCSYKLTVVPNPNPPHPSRPNMITPVLDSFEQKTIDLATDKPLLIPITSNINYRSDKLSDKNFFIVAIKKSQASDLEAKIKDVVLNTVKVDDILSIALRDTLQLAGSGNKGAAIVVNKININQNRIELTVEEGNSAGGKCIGLGLFLFGIVFISGWWTRKKFQH